MKTALLGFALLLSLTSTGWAQTDDQSFDEAALREDARKTLKNNVAPFVKSYCISCHGGYAQAGVNLQSALDSPESATSFLHWQKAVANVKVHDMPPEGSGEIPTDEEREEFVRWIGKLKYIAERDPGPFVMRRLSKVEYGNTLRDLYGIDPSVADSLPEEVVGEGYLNSISPMQSELFVDIASKVIAQVVAPEGQPPTKIQSRFFGDTPPDDGDYRSAARRVARTLARDAYRRPPTDAEIDVLIGIFDLGRENELSYTASLALMWKAVLLSPQFLFITPTGLNEAYYSHCSFHSPTQAVPAEVKPRTVLNRLFNKQEQGAGAASSQMSPLDRELLDRVLAGARDLRRTLPPTGQRKLDEYLDSVRSVERRIAAIDARQKEAAMEKTGVRSSRKHESDSPPIEIKIPEGDKRSE